MKDARMVRYILLMMGTFAIFNGFIYNEFFALPVDFFGSCFSGEKSNNGDPTNAGLPIQYNSDTV